MTRGFIADNSEHFNVVTVFHSQCKELSAEFHCRMPGIEILLPPYPATEILSGNKRVEVNLDSAMLFNDWAGHYERFLGTTCPITSIKISAEYIKTALSAIAIAPEELFFDRHVIPKDLKIIQEICDLVFLLRNSKSSYFTVDCVLTHLLNRLFTEHANTHSERFKMQLRSGHFPDRVSKIKAVLLEHLFDPHFDLDRLATEAGLSKFHLIRIFKQSTGLSPAAYLRHLKTDYAKGSLLRDSRPVISIAQDLGYRDLSTFNKSFKKLTSKTPSSFRKTAREK